MLLLLVSPPPPLHPPAAHLNLHHAGCELHVGGLVPALVVSLVHALGRQQVDVAEGNLHDIQQTAGGAGTLPLLPTAAGRGVAAHTAVSAGGKVGVTGGPLAVEAAPRGTGVHTGASLWGADGVRLRGQDAAGHLQPVIACVLLQAPIDTGDHGVPGGWGVAVLEHTLRHVSHVLHPPAGIPSSGLTHLPARFPGPGLGHISAGLGSLGVIKAERATLPVHHKAVGEAQVPQVSHQHVVCAGAFRDQQDGGVCLNVQFDASTPGGLVIDLSTERP